MKILIKILIHKLQRFYLLHNHLFEENFFKIKKSFEIKSRLLILKMSLSLSLSTSLDFTAAYTTIECGCKIIVLNYFLIKIDQNPYNYSNYVYVREYVSKSYHFY